MLVIARHTMMSAEHLCIWLLALARKNKKISVLLLEGETPGFCCYAKQKEEIVVHFVSSMHRLLIAWGAGYQNGQYGNSTFNEPLGTIDSYFSSELSKKTLCAQNVSPTPQPHNFPGFICGNKKPENQGRKCETERKRGLKI